MVHTPNPRASESTWKDKLIFWVLQQGVSTVLLVMILVYGAYMGRYIVDVAVPMHIRSIVDGFDKQAAAHTEGVNRITDEWSRERELTRELLREIQRSNNNYQRESKSTIFDGTKLNEAGS